jgi:hypothetical protein
MEFDGAVKSTATPIRLSLLCKKRWSKREAGAGVWDSCAECATSVAVKYRVVARTLHEINRVRAITSIHVALAASRNCLSISSVVNPVPMPAVVLLLPIAGIRNLCHKRSHFCKGKLVRRQGDQSPPARPLGADQKGPCIVAVGMRIKNFLRVPDAAIPTEHPAETARCWLPGSHGVSSFPGD